MVVPFQACSSQGGRISQEQAAYRSQITTAEQLFRLQRSPEYRAWLRKKKGWKQSAVLMFGTILVIIFATACICHGLIKTDIPHKASMENTSWGADEVDHGFLAVGSPEASHEVKFVEQEDGALKDEQKTIDCESLKEGVIELSEDRLLEIIELPPIEDLAAAISSSGNTSMNVCWLEEGPLFIHKSSTQDRQWMSIVFGISLLILLGAAIHKVFFASNANVSFRDSRGLAARKRQFQAPSLHPHQAELHGKEKIEESQPEEAKLHSTEIVEESQPDEAELHSTEVVEEIADDVTPELKVVEFTAELEQDESLPNDEKDPSMEDKESVKENASLRAEVVEGDDPPLVKKDAEPEDNQSIEVRDMHRSKENRESVFDVKLKEVQKQCDILQKGTLRLLTAQVENERLKSDKKSHQIVRIRCKNKEKKMASLKAQHDKALMKRLAMEGDLQEAKEKKTQAQFS
ncbi:hypothetical protein BSKO_07166 [Bryopsis sp. KO-2023]|nr:hypothetical protein BSKO_07166 [Bryopsis sp. KO-2023]